ncbi:MAG: hypothetical protein LQ343_006265 [Gyalolechia ehrenbergii]|nr:MAG: hypothetical protein LQ343_006265 [Gyalolechia ehrenbergii]
MAESRPARTDKLNGTHVLVIGGSSGLGFGVAQAALDQGAHVTIASSRKEKVDKALSRLSQAQEGNASSISGHVCDLSKVAELEDNLSQLFQAATSTKKIDHLVHTAGDVLEIKPFAETSASEMLAWGTVRFLGALVIGKLAPKYLNPGPKSSITFTSGTMSHRPKRDVTMQAAWGSGIEGATRGLSVDLAPIRVNCVCPGAIHTELFEHIPPQARTSVMNEFRDWSLLNVMGSPEEVAESYIYLMKTTFATGTTTVVDGGRLIK